MCLCSTLPPNFQLMPCSSILRNGPRSACLIPQSFLHPSREFPVYYQFNILKRENSDSDHVRGTSQSRRRREEKPAFGLRVVTLGRFDCSPSPNRPARGAEGPEHLTVHSRVLLCPTAAGVASGNHRAGHLSLLTALSRTGRCTQAAGHGRVLRRGHHHLLPSPPCGLEAVERETLPAGRA